MQTGILLALISAALFGASTPLAKIMLGNVDPWILAGLLYLGAGLVLRFSTCLAASLFIRRWTPRFDFRTFLG